MTGSVADLLRRAGEWFVEPEHAADQSRLLIPGLDRDTATTHPVVAVVGLARRAGATTIARALGTELAARADGAALVSSPERPAVVGLGSSPAAARLAQGMSHLGPVRTAGRLCLAVYADLAEVAAAARTVAPTVIEVEPGVGAIEAAPVVDRVVLVASPSLEPALAAAVGETIEAVAAAPVVAVNRAPDHGPWLVAADVLVPESRVGARFALAGREARGWLGRSVQQLADLCR